MSTLNRDLEEKTVDELKAELQNEYRKRKIFLILTIVTTVLFLAAILIYLFAVIPNPLVPIIGFALFITSFMLFAYSRQNIAQLEERIKD
ncbi:MAG: hypothetical protein J5847_01265 [Clostridia bacterium]|nr:hypothetical protein [Clostridia bacterium]